MSTAVLDRPVDLSAYEFSIACEWPHCDKNATVMSKGCADPQHVATCGEHLVKLWQDFEACKPAVCSVCYRPFLYFENHFDIQDI